MLVLRHIHIRLKCCVGELAHATLVILTAYVQSAFIAHFRADLLQVHQRQLRFTHETQRTRIPMIRLPICSFTQFKNVGS